MAQVVRNEVKYDHHFDPQSKRHYVNGTLSVLHCHHYSSLYSQLALDANETDLLKDSARESFKETLCRYFATYDVPDNLQGKIALCCQYYAILGLGKMKVIFLGDNSGEVELLHSHIDNGWLKKWGIYDKPVNYISGGFIEAMFELVLDLADGSFNAVETKSIVMGDETSQFTVTRR